MKWTRTLLVLLAILLAGPLFGVACSARSSQDWRSASRASAGIAPPAATTREAVIQVYAARAFRWRGAFAVHTWIATKATGAAQFEVHQVIGWRARRGGSAVFSSHDVPDRHWYGAAPDLLLDLRGPRAAALLPKIAAAIADYPYGDSYTLWPGPNSNTFVAHVARSVPELQLELPVTAIGKDYLGGGRVLSPAPSGTGYQLSLFGLTGLTLAWREGLEFNLLGLVLGLDADEPALKLPGIGRIGFASDPRRGE